MTQEKLLYITDTFFTQIKDLGAEQKGNWGKMNAQQMIEHLTYSVRFANGKNYHDPIFPKEQLDKVRSFFLSEKQFRENTTNAMLPAEPDPLRNPDMSSAVSELKTEVNEWIRQFQSGEKKSSVNPLAGEFTFDEWVHLFHKHFVHHARQFGLSA